jgi:hypothetical protein
LIQRLHAGITRRPGANQRYLVLIGPRFPLGVVQLSLITPFTAALEPFVRDKGFTIMAGKRPRSRVRIELERMNFPTEARAAIFDRLSTNQFVVYTHPAHFWISSEPLPSQLFESTSPSMLLNRATEKVLGSFRSG